MFHETIIWLFDERDEGYVLFTVPMRHRHFFRIRSALLPIQCPSLHSHHSHTLSYTRTCYSLKHGWTTTSSPDGSRIQISAASSQGDRRRLVASAATTPHDARRREPERARTHAIDAGRVVRQPRDDRSVAGCASRCQRDQLAQLERSQSRCHARMQSCSGVAHRPWR